MKYNDISGSKKINIYSSAFIQLWYLAVLFYYIETIFYIVLGEFLGYFLCTIILGRLWFVTNQILRCCHKIEGEWTFLMAVTGEGRCR